MIFGLQTQPVTLRLAGGIQTELLDAGLWQQDPEEDNHLVKFISSPFLHHEQESTEGCGSKVSRYLHGF